MRLVSGNLDDGEIGVTFAEDGVHLFEAAARSLWVEDVDHGKYESVTKEEISSELIIWKAETLIDRY